MVSSDLKAHIKSHQLKNYNKFYSFQKILVADRAAGFNSSGTSVEDYSYKLSYNDIQTKQSKLKALTTERSGQGHLTCNFKPELDKDSIDSIKKL